MRTEEFVNKIWEGTTILFPVMNLSSEISIEALIINERVINKTYPFGHEPLLTTLLPFAVQLGKVLIKEIPGTKWIDKEIEHPYDLAIEIPTNYGNGEKMIVYPVNRVQRFWIESREHSLSNMAISSKFLSENDITNPELQLKADKEGWLDIGNGNLIRITTVKKEDLPN